MRFRIRTETTGGLRVIDEIPDYPLARLEGVNGVGKTVAVHLLELATGFQPYAHQPAAWRSLREHLKTAEIEVTGLRTGGERLEIRLTPQLWPDDPTGPDARFGVVRLDDEPMAFADLPPILKVRRIGGDETMLVQIRRRVRADADAFARGDEWVQRQLAALESLADSLFELGQGLTGDALRDIDERGGQLAEQRKQEEARLSRLVDQEHLVDTLIAREVALSQIAARGPVLDERIKVLDADIRKQERKREVLRRRRDELQPIADRAKVLAKSIKSLERRRAIQRGQLESERSKLKGMLEAAASSPDRLADDLAAAQHEQQLLQRERKAIGRLPEAMQAISALGVPLGAAIDAGLEDEVLAVVRTERATAEDLRFGTAIRRGELESIDEYRVVEEIDVRLAALSDRVKLLDMAASLVPSVATRTTSLSETERALKQAFEQARATSGEAYAAVINEMEDLDKQLADNIATRAELRQSRAMLNRYGTATALREEIAAVREALGDERESTELQESIREEAVKVRIALDELEKHAELAVTSRQDFASRLNLAFERLTSADLLWLMDTRADPPLEDPNDTRFLGILSGVVEKVQRFRQAVDALPLRTGRIRAVYAGLADQIGQTVLSRDGERLMLLEFYEQELGALLGAPQIEASVLEGGSFKELDLASAELSWLDPEGKPVRRPLEAFSSGQAAFTYILASILQRSEQPASNQVLVLDEFGAFIQGDRIRILLEFLETEVLQQERAEQVLVVLPLRQIDDPSTPDEVGGLRAQVELRGYAVMEIRQ